MTYSLLLGPGIKSSTKRNNAFTWREIKREINAQRPIAMYSNVHWKVCYGYHEAENLLLIANPLRKDPEKIPFFYFQQLDGECQYGFTRG
jgi:hypothetical protein